MQTRVDLSKARDRALEAGVYVPLGVYSKMRDQISDLDAGKLRRAYEDLVARGEKRAQPLERMIKRRAGDVEVRAGDAANDMRRGVRKAEARSRAAGAAVAPKMPRVAAPRRASELPLKSYDELTADEVLSKTRGLTQTDMAKVYKYEKNNESRSTVLEGLEARFVELPLPTYDALTVDEIADRLDAFDDDALRKLLAYEKDTKARSTVIEGIEAKL